MKYPQLKKHIAHLCGATAALSAAWPGPVRAEDGTGAQEVVITGKRIDALPAAALAPSKASLDAVSAMSIVGEEFIRDYSSPIADYSQILMATPGVFGFSPNGVGLGDTKITLRGQTDSNFVISFDGIPFNDTNGVSHHSWVFFPSQFLGGAVVDRSPGSAATIGQATFGGTVDLRSRRLDPQAGVSVEASGGTWNTHLVGAEYESGDFDFRDHQANFLINAHEMKSDGYQTFNKQDRKAASGKFRIQATADTQVTVFGSYLELVTNTPSVKGILRSDYDNGIYNNLLSGVPGSWNYYGYNFYDIHTGWLYVGVASNLGGGWKLDDKVYTYRYDNKQNYNNTTNTSNPPVSATSGVDKLNSYTTIGNLLRLTRESGLGTLRFGLWADRSDSYRYQIKSDPRTWVDVAVPNFSETYRTTTLQPYIEHEFRFGDALKVTPGVKLASYRQSFVHLQDNGGAVGPLGGVFSSATNTITGGAPSLANRITYRDTMPSLAVHYLAAENWSVYGQAAVGDEIPSTSVFDVKNAQVSPPPKSTKATTVQFGTVKNSAGYTFAADVFHIRLDGAYTALPPDSAGNVGYVLSGSETDQGVEFEGNYLIGGGFSVFGNATFISLKYSNGQWVAGAPKDTETVGVNYTSGGWGIGLMANRIGRQYNDDKAGNHQAFAIDAVTLTNLNVNYTIRSPFSAVQRIKLQASVDNLTNSHRIVGVAGPVTGSSGAAPSANDLLTVLPARSVNLTATVTF